MTCPGWIHTSKNHFQRASPLLAPLPTRQITVNKKEQKTWAACSHQDSVFLQNQRCQGTRNISAHISKGCSPLRHTGPRPLCLHRPMDSCFFKCTAENSVHIQKLKNTKSQPQGSRIPLTPNNICSLSLTTASAQHLPVSLSAGVSIVESITELSLLQRLTRFKNFKQINIWEAFSHRGGAYIRNNSSW